MALPIALALFASCKDSKSYSELLDDEEKSINSFLAHQKVLKQIPADTVFQTGADAPYYQIDDNGNVYMQVLKAGDRTNNRAQEGETIYFRFGRISINRWSAGYEDAPSATCHTAAHRSNFPTRKPTTTTRNTATELCCHWRLLASTAKSTF